MSLDTLLFKVIIPPAEVLKTADAREKFERDNDCEFRPILEPKEIQKLEKTKFVLEWDQDFIDWEKTFEAYGKKREDYEDGFGAINGLYIFVLKNRASQSEILPHEEFRITSNYCIPYTQHVKGFCIQNRSLHSSGVRPISQFYKDGKWDDNTLVVTQEELLHDWEFYFDKNEFFYDDIVENFVEDEMIVCYW